jgi:hypothetical protein
VSTAIGGWGRSAGYRVFGGPPMTIWPWKRSAGEASRPWAWGPSSCTTLGTARTCPPEAST